YAWIGFADPQGRVMSATDNLLLGKQVDQRPWFQAGLKGPFLGDVHEAKLLASLLPKQATGEPLRLIDFAVPVYDAQNKLRGVLGAHAHWTWVTQIVESVITDTAARRQVEALISSPQGDILYPYRLMGTRLPEGINIQDPYEVLRWSDGEDYLTSTAALN